ncbi:MAG: UDP-N-acetylmuramoyl-L-alanine--D-glutamate ligase [Planctomycetes bacterium]|jgi:UDP-N-acetylmuramoylalanine--D-glutamate ligase|nr:UDP-N-acetylmuramoyl-L-alanine--D-glutamate ligase [Planctomycetota bacterium]MCL4731875.1 UDP-N-acetylmuramoyl-L-alanine--D-glutamate ligase [Planctomycetota bacterium]
MTPEHLQPFERFRGRRGLVMGLGLFGGGVEAAKFLCGYCPHVVVTDLRDAGVLRESMDELKGLPIEYRLGEHREQDFRDAQVVIHSPAVRPDHKLLQLARDSGAEVTQEMSLFIEACPATTIGITGSNGKTTTTALCYEMLCEVLERAQPELEGQWADPVAVKPGPGRRVWLGGNIGTPLLNRLGEMTKDDVAVLELSSFQLMDWHRIKKSCDIAVVTNITPNHLDWHTGFDEYVRAKCAIFDYQPPRGVIVLNLNNDVCRQLAEYEPDRAVTFAVDPGQTTLRERPDLVSMNDMLLFMGAPRRKLVPPAQDTDFVRREDLALSGLFNWANALAAVGAFVHVDCGGSIGHIKQALRRFRGVEHRLEFCGTVNGARCYNDSIATDPAATLAALGVFRAGVHLILGGASDKGAGYEKLAAAIAAHPGIAGLYLQGPTAGRLRAALNAAGVKAAPDFADFDSACRAAFAAARPGQVVLMSPASTSFYEHAPGKKFTNFEDRGRHFKALVKAHPSVGSEVKA